MYGLTCQAPGLIKDLQWFSHDGDPIMSSHTVRVGKIVQQNEISSLTLYFCPLSPEDAGRYFCKSNSLSAKVKITVQSKFYLRMSWGLLCMLLHLTHYIIDSSCQYS